ncbi:hypothetical protein [Sulfuriroseicoccus oceanibius]|uniref:Type II secretion system protein n=1 Tax=Sulfuriroseicoccus oceanibius TaxID=2707525 RepID=A0A6B3LBP7_9BACT|nr:hypothetical protein [Sulfuriroseicoccus oceanibius]QQL44663.1 hypothetical protein G3M56_012350 [Sulfuriroseicoccus oceanibius]
MMKQSTSSLAMVPKRNVLSRRQGVTVLEWLMLLGLVFGFGVVLVTGAMRAPMMKKAQQTRTELEEIERALLEGADEKNWQVGKEVEFDDLRPLIRKKFKRMLKEGRDPLGNAYGLFEVGSLPGVPDASYERFEEVVPDGFWTPYGPASEKRPALDRDF